MRVVFAAVFVCVALAGVALGEPKRVALGSHNPPPEVSLTTRVMNKAADIMGTRPEFIPAPRRQYAVENNRAVARQPHLLKKNKDNSHRIPIGAEEVNYPYLYWVEAEVGTPAKPFRLNLDTGSSTLAIPSKDCTNCEDHVDQPFDATSSSSYHQVPCDSDECNGGESGNQCAPSDEDICGFQVQYGDGSGVTGIWGKDQVTFAGLTVDMYFGHFTELLGGQSFEPHNVDGIIGVADRSINENLAGKAFDTVVDAIHRQLDSPQVFSMCFGRKGGSMVMGAVDTCHMKHDPSYTPAIFSEGFWGAGVSAMSVGDSDISPSRALVEETMIDSGTTMWILDDDTYNQVREIIIDQCDLEDCDKIIESLEDNKCMKKEYVSSFPDITVQFDGGATLTVPNDVWMSNTLCGDDDYVTLGITAGGNMNIWGDVLMRPFTWVFDRDASRIGFAEMGACDVLPSEGNKCVGDSSNVGVIVGSVMASLVVVGAVAGGVVHKRRRDYAARQTMRQAMLK